MTILWCGGEDIDFPNGGPVTIEPYSARYRPAYGVRCALLMSGGAGGARSNNFPGGAVTSAWLSFQNSFGYYPNPATLLAGLVKDSTSMSGLYVGVSSSSSLRLALIKYDGTTKTQLAVEVADSYQSAVVSKIDMQITGYGSNATVNVFLNSALIISYTGDVTVSGVTSLSAAAIVSNSYSAVSEIIVADEDTRLFSLATAAPNAAGTTNQWTGAYTDVNEVTTNDANLIYTNTDSQNSQFNLIDMPTGTFSVKAVKLSARAAKSADSSVGTLKIGINSGGTVNVDSGQALTTGWATYERLMQVNPITSNAFTPAEVNALQLNLQSAT